MPYSLSDLEQEITDTIEREKDSGNGAIPADWVAHAVMAAHPQISGEDKDFYTVCSYRTVREATRRVMSKYGRGELESPQATLDGFEFLQTHYVVSDTGVDGDVIQTMKHIDMLTYEELTAKAVEHEAVGMSHLKHRDEIYRFRDSKFKDMAA